MFDIIYQNYLEKEFNHKNEYKFYALDKNNKIIINNQMYEYEITIC